MDSPRPWSERLRRRENSSKPSETSTTVQPVGKTRRKITTEKNEAVKRARKKGCSAQPSGKPTRANLRKRKANDFDHYSVHSDSERETKRTCSPEPLPTTPTSEARRTERLGTSQTQRDEHNLTISPPAVILVETSLPTPSLTGGCFNPMVGSITAFVDSSSSESPIEDVSLALQSLVTVDSNASNLLSPPISNQRTSQPPEPLTISIGESSRIQRPFHSVPVTTSSSEGSSRCHTAEQSQTRHTLEPAFEYVSTRNSGNAEGRVTEESSQVSGRWDYTEHDDVPEAQGVDSLQMLADLATASQRTEDPLDLHEIVPYLFLGSYSVFMPSNIKRFRTCGIGRIFTICPLSESSNDWGEEADKIIDNDANFIRRRIEIVDHPKANLLRHLQRLVQELDVIIESREQVYVHCYMGRSRSAAVVVAYLMKKNRIDFIQACRLVCDRGREININQGFRQQLQIWDLIKDDWDNRETYAAYRYWKMANHAEPYRYGTQSIILASREPNRRTMMEFTEIFPIPQDKTNPVAGIRQFPDLQKPDHSWYRCYRCRYPLAPGDATFGFSDHHGERPECTHRFLCNPLSWMVDQIDVYSPGGKLFCPNCQDYPQHVGEYCWLGLQCSCGEVVSPGLALLSKVEDGHIRTVEFRRVQEGSVDGDEVESSEETESQEGNEDVDDVDEDDFDCLSESQEQQKQESPEEDAATTVAADDDDNTIIAGFVEMLSESEEADEGVEGIPLESDVITDSQDVEWSTFLTGLQHQVDGTQDTVIAQPNLRMIPRSIPIVDDLPQLIRNPHHLPMIPSRLRNTWKPPSRSSSGNSQESESSNSSNVTYNNNVVVDELGEIDWGSVGISDPEEIDYQRFVEELAYDQYR